MQSSAFKAASVALALGVLSFLVVQACRSTPGASGSNSAAGPSSPAASASSPAASASSPAVEAGVTKAEPSANAVVPTFLPASKAGPIMPVQQASGSPK